jgi:hypothetical protein
MSFTTTNNGRLCNQIIRNLSASLIAEKFDLYIEYSSNEKIKQLGIHLYVGTHKYVNTIDINEDNYLSILGLPELNTNINLNYNYFQTKEITNILYTYLHSDKNKQLIINSNPYNARYNNNNDVFIHIRLTDVADNNPGLEYYLNAINKLINFDNIFIASDDITNELIKKICYAYPNVILFLGNEVNTIQFGSTCKHIILSHGSFSAVIGYLGFYSNVLYPEFNNKLKLWCGDMISIDGWNSVTY